MTAWSHTRRCGQRNSLHGQRLGSGHQRARSLGRRCTSRSMGDDPRSAAARAGQRALPRPLTGERRTIPRSASLTLARCRPTLVSATREQRWVPAWGRTAALRSLIGAMLTPPVDREPTPSPPGDSLAWRPGRRSACERSCGGNCKGALHLLPFLRVAADASDTSLCTPLLEGRRRCRARHALQ